MAPAGMPVCGGINANQTMSVELFGQQFRLSRRVAGFDAQHTSGVEGDDDAGQKLHALSFYTRFDS